MIHLCSWYKKETWHALTKAVQTCSFVSTFVFPSLGHKSTIIKFLFYYLDFKNQVPVVQMAGVTSSF